jgi:hypothetical protein
MRVDMRSCMTLALGFAAGLAFVSGCPLDSGPSVAWAEEGDCGQWEVSAWRHDGNSYDTLPGGFHPFAAAGGGDSYRVFGRRCVSQ